MNVNYALHVLQERYSELQNINYRLQEDLEKKNLEFQNISKTVQENYRRLEDMKRQIELIKLEEKYSG